MSVYKAFVFIIIIVVGKNMGKIWEPFRRKKAKENEDYVAFIVTALTQYSLVIFSPRMVISLDNAATYSWTVYKNPYITKYSMGHDATCCLLIQFAGWFQFN